MLPLPFDAKRAKRSRPSLDKIREVIGVDESVKITFVASVPCLYQGWECDEWAYVVRDDAMNRYLLTSNHGRWELGDAEDLRKLVHLYSVATQVAVKGLVELTEGRQQEEHRLGLRAAKEIGLSLTQDEVGSNPALQQAVEGLVDAAKKTLKGDTDG